MTKEVVTATAVGLPLANEVTNDGIVTALQLENMAMLGLTFGAWFKIGMAVALALLILERMTTIILQWRKNNCDYSTTKRT